jgi:hypothetical protein
MDPKEAQQLKEETFATYRTQITALQENGEEVHVVVDNEEIKALSNRLGYFDLGKIRVCRADGQEWQGNSLHIAFVYLSERRT